MKLTRIMAIALTMSFSSAFSLAADCTKPTAPDIPNGATTSEKNMLAAQEDVKDFIAEGRQYLSCVKNKEAELAKDASTEERQAIVERYNAMVDKMKTASNQFNQAVNEYQKNLEEAE